MMPTGPCPSPLMIVGEAPGVEEERIGKPFVGASGQELDRMLHEAGLLRSEAFVTNVCRVRPPGNNLDFFFSRKKKPPPGQWEQFNGVWAKPELIQGVAQLQREIALCKPKVIVALGNLSLWSLTGKWGVMDWRGSGLKYALNPATTVIPTLHPAAILRMWSWRPYVICDLRRVKSAITDPVDVPPYRFVEAPHYVQAYTIIQSLLARVQRGPVHIAVDIETRAGHIACIGLGWSKYDALCIPLMKSPAGSYWLETEEFHLMKVLRDLLTHPNCLVSGQNFSYDAQYFQRHLGYIPNLALDTMVTHHVCFPGTDKGLDVLSSLYCENHVFWKNDGKEWHQRQDEKVLWHYNCEDAVRTWEIAEVLVETVVKLGLEGPCLFQHRMWGHVVQTMLDGVKVAIEAKKQLSSELATEKAAREAWLAFIFGHPVNPRSPAQMKRLFYDDLKLPVQYKRTKEGPRPSLDETSLKTLAKKEPVIRPVVKRLLEIRSLGVFKSTFVDATLDRDQRMRTSYNVAGTETYRLSSSENAFGSGLNMQNIPGENKDSPDEEFYLDLPNVRKLFVPDPGCEIADMDLSQADLRIVVEEADEEEMRQLLEAGLDPYTEIAKEFYNDKTITKKDPRRAKFKAFAHGTHYLGTPKGLAGRIGLSIADAERTQAWYFKRFPRIQQYGDRIRTAVNEKRAVSNVFGYRRYYFDRLDATLYNQAAAWIPQSTVGLLINHIWDQTRTHAPEIRVSLQVHDSLVFQYPIEVADESKAKLLTLSRYPIPYARPLIIPTGLKTSRVSWGDCS